MENFKFWYLKCQDDLYGNIRKLVELCQSYAQNTSRCIICNLNKFVFPNSQGSAATQLRYVYFVGNFMRLSPVKNSENLLRYDKVWLIIKRFRFFPDSMHVVAVLFY